MNKRKYDIPELNNIFFDGNVRSGTTRGSEAAIMQRLAKSLSEGDEKAWEELYVLLYDSISAFIRRIVRSKEEASDLTQDVFISLWENVPRIDPTKNIRGYLYAIAKTFSLKLLRDRVQAHGFDPDINLPDLEDIAPDELLMADEMKILIAITLETMPPQRRRVFEMSRYEGMSYNEIAAALGISKRTVERHIYDASRQFKELLYIIAVLIALQGLTH